MMNDASHVVHDTTPVVAWAEHTPQSSGHSTITIELRSSRG